ncbi:DUF2130 domain-containing protein [Emticicia sp. TH156]|uniref:DUF2130 domain-containing protein n=1 Tax=Emticicia sp. TH156 TaxID=2067454 RepID=UPI000C78FC7B|nr:DUF2130 domain-containing protein [Emticicia sp. TH156]PLK42117.1 hypothetical protein C0V77_22535 [Emticicia sp. TH156]
MNNHIQCPKCKHEINIESVIAERIEAEQMAKFSTKANALAQKEQTLAQEQANLQRQVATLLEQEKTKLLPQLKAAINAEKEQQLNSLQAELNEKSSQVATLKMQEGELLRQKRQLEEARAGIDAEVEKRLATEKAILLANLREKVQNETLVELKQKDLIIEQMKTQINEMKRKAEQGSMQLQGEAQEVVIEEILRLLHRFDEFEEIKTGELGADILQRVFNRTGQCCGSILFESKNTKGFSEQWVEKLKEDMRLKKADLGVIVTRALPKGVSSFEQREENLWICSFEHFKPLTFALRALLLKVEEIRIVQANQGDKSKLLYEYLVGTEFKTQLKNIHDTFSGMHQSLFKEKKAALLNFKKREKEIDRIMRSLTDIAGSINGISGQTVAEFTDFEEIEDDTNLLE